MSAPLPKVVLVAQDGRNVEVTVATTLEYEFKPGQIVHFTKSLRNGKVALIRGISDGLLWFSVFRTVEDAMKDDALNAPIETTSCRVKAELIRQYGWVVDDNFNEKAHSFVAEE